jgi:hypothetical protein
MPLPSSGAISFGDIDNIIGQSGQQISLDDPLCRSLSGDLTGTVRMSDFYGKPRSGSITQTIPGTYTLTVPAGVTSMSVEIVGGGGGGGAGGYSCGNGGTGSGGGSGGIIQQTVPVDQLSVVTYVVGAGGKHAYNIDCGHNNNNAGSSGSDYGGSGGSSSFGDLTATGGEGGHPDAYGGGADGGAGGSPGGVDGSASPGGQNNYAGEPGGQNGSGYGGGGRSGANGGIGFIEGALNGQNGVVIIRY